MLDFVRYGESIADRASRGDPRGLLDREIRHRLRGTLEGVLDLAASVEDVLGRVDGSPARDLAELVEADRGARDLMAVAAS